MSRAYDYACPAFGGFSVPQPYWEQNRKSNKTVTAALIKQASIISNSGHLSRGNSSEGRAPLARTDSSPRSPLARMDSGSKIMSSSTTSDSSYGRSTTVSSPSYRTSSGNNYRHFSYK